MPKLVTPTDLANPSPPFGSPPGAPWSRNTTVFRARPAAAVRSPRTWSTATVHWTPWEQSRWMVTAGAEKLLQQVAVCWWFCNVYCSGNLLNLSTLWSAIVRTKQNATQIDPNTCQIENCLEHLNQQRRQPTPKGLCLSPPDSQFLQRHSQVKGLSGHRPKKNGGGAAAQAGNQRCHKSVLGPCAGQEDGRFQELRWPIWGANCFIRAFFINPEFVGM